MYDVKFSKSAERQLFRLETNIQMRIVSTLDRTRIRPYPHIKKLVGSPYFRLRVGDYRVIMDIVQQKLIIYVIEIGHRKNTIKCSKRKLR